MSLVYANVVLCVLSVNSNSFNLACPIFSLYMYTYTDFNFKVDSISPPIFNSLSFSTASFIGVFQSILMFDVACTFIENKNNIHNNEINLGNK